MRKVKTYNLKVQFSALLIFITLLFTSKIAYADVIYDAQSAIEHGSRRKIEPIAQFLGYGFIILILSLISLLLIFIIRRIIIKAIDVKNDVQVRKLIHDQVIEKRKCQENTHKTKEKE